jgi:hypothetical protein
MLGLLVVELFDVLVPEGVYLDVLEPDFVHAFPPRKILDYINT